MTRKKKKIFLFTGIILCLALFIYYSDHASSPAPIPPPAYHPEIFSSRYGSYVITDEAGTQELMRVRVDVNVGDEVLTEDNKLYEITRVEKDHAYAKYVKQLKL